MSRHARKSDDLDAVAAPETPADAAPPAVEPMEASETVQARPGAETRPAGQEEAQFPQQSSSEAVVGHAETPVAVVDTPPVAAAPSVQRVEAQQPTPSPRGDAASGPAKRAKPAQVQEEMAAPAGDVAHGSQVLPGEAERKRVEVAALTWAATARKVAEKERILRVEVQAALEAGTPAELIVAALVQAETRSGYRLDPQVRALAERRKRAQ